MTATIRKTVSKTVAVPAVDSVFPKSEKTDEQATLILLTQRLLWAEHSGDRDNGHHWREVWNRLVDLSALIGDVETQNIVSLARAATWELDYDGIKTFEIDSEGRLCYTKDRDCFHYVIEHCNEPLKVDWDYPIDSDGETELSKACPNYLPIVSREATKSKQLAIARNLC